MEESFSIVARPNGQATVPLQTKSRPFYIIFCLLTSSGAVLSQLCANYDLGQDPRDRDGTMTDQKNQGQIELEGTMARPRRALSKPRRG
jgi:hypothetical protein